MSNKEIIEAWAWVRKNNNSIPDDVLDLMKDSAIAALQNKVSDIGAEEVFKTFWHKRNPVHEINSNTGEDMFWGTAELVAREYVASIVNERKDSAGSWVKASERLPGVIDKKCTPVFVRAEIKGYGGKVYISKRVAFYFPDHLKTIEFEDWDDYNEEDYPYIENDQEKGVYWLRAGWYESVNCEKCEDYWNSPINVIEWLDESQPKKENALFEKDNDVIVVGKCANCGVEYHIHENEYKSKPSK